MMWYIIYIRKAKKGNDSMMKNVNVEYHESGLIISQVGVDECLTVPSILKENFYLHMINACLRGGSFSWIDLCETQITMKYQYKNKFDVFINGRYVGELPFIRLSETSVAIPVDTTDDEKLFEVYDSELMETYLLYESELF